MRTFPCCGFQLPDGVIDLTEEASKLHRKFHDTNLAAVAVTAPDTIADPHAATRADVLMLQLQLDRITAALVLAGIDIPTTPGADAYIARHKLTGADR